MGLRLLVLGGTRFVGRHFAQAARAAGHHLTLFNRGQSGPAPVEGIVELRGDRRSDLSALAQGEWDAVVDCCGYLPREVQASASLLRARVGRYLFVSSVSAYASFVRPNREDLALGVLAAPGTEVIDGDTYGPLKAACEQRVQDAFGERALIIRPGLVVGPHDPTERFTYWPARVAQAVDGEPVLLPGAAGDPLQWIDARDLAAFMLRGVERGMGGAFNLVTAPAAHDWGGLVQACADAAGCQPQWVWAEPRRLLDLGVKPWQDLPLWLPADAEHAAFMASDNAAAVAAGLQTRPVLDTVADTLRWWRALPAGQQSFTKAGISREREGELLAALKR